MATTGYFSHSDNFVNSVASNVDPRSGMYTCTATLGHNSENLFRGPKIPLAIGYSPFQTQQLGLGMGWAFNFSSYDEVRTILTCMTGENYTIDHTGPYYTLKQAKLTSLSMTAGDSWYRIDHGDGTIEILTGPDHGGKLKVPTTIYSPTGAAYSFTWDMDTNGAPRISSITDDMNATVMSVVYESSKFTLKLWPGSTNEIVYTGIINEQQLVSLSASGTDAGGSLQSWSWSFHYVNMDPHGMVLNQVTYPMGMIEKVTYRLDGHAYPSGGPDKPLPYVTELTRNPNGDGPIETFKYDFSKKNFLGGGAKQAAIPYQPTMDNLYAHAGESPAYVYTSTITHVDGDNTPVVTTRTYDTFHRLITERDEYENSTWREQQTTYAGNANQSFENQPNNYQLPTLVKTTYSTLESKGQAQRSEDTHYTYDTDDGVRTMMTTPDGVITDYDYYPASGTTATKVDDFTYQCPASLSGRKAHIKTITITYPSVDNAGNPIDARTEVHEFAWDSIKLPGSDQSTGPAPYAVVPTTVRSSTIPHGKNISNGVKTKLRLLNITYVNSGKHLGRVNTATEQLPDENGKFRDVAQLAMTYTTTKDTFTEQLTYTGYLPTSVTATASRSFCVRTGQMTQNVNQLDVVTTRAYDWLGRIQTLTTASSTDYARATSCAYSLAKLHDTDDAPTLSAIVSQGDARQLRVVCDGASRATAMYKGDADTDVKNWPQIATASYDALGRPFTSTIKDYTQTGGQTKNTSNAKGSFGYDNWTINNLREVTNGPWRRDDFDPVTLEGVASWTRNVSPSASGNTLTKYDTLQTPTSVTRKTAKGKVDGVSTMVHDGRKRLRIHTDEAGNTVTASYDDWNRPTTLTLADNTSVGVTYDTAFTKNLPTAISINALTVATRSYDGLGRVTTEAWGKQESTWTYTGAGKRPTSHAITGGNTVDFTYVDELGQAIASRKVSGGALSHTFSYYDNKNDLNIPAGLLKTATQTDSETGNSVTVTRAYDVWGRLTSEQITMDGKTLGKAATWTYTALGKPLTYTDPTGRKFTLTYDANGRLSGIDTGALNAGEPTVAYSYDDANGRISGWAVKAKGQSLATASISYDDFGRETSRTIAIEGGETLTITGGNPTGSASDKYGPNSLVKQTSVLVSSATDPVQENSYTYDARRRLKKYTCSGPKAPATASGTPLTSIDYTYDDYNNITAVTRNTAAGPENTTYSYVTDGDDANPFVLDKLNDAKVTSDAAGATTAMNGRTFTYDGFGRLASVTDGDKTTTYRYDALNRLICQTPAQGDPIYFFYAGDALATIVRSPDGDIGAGDDTTWLHAAGGPALERGPNGTTIIAADASGTVTGWAAPGAKTFNIIAWDPYGAASNIPANAPMLGYNGHYRDAETGLQHLGNGYRPYDPTIGRFLAPDTESPFGKGGHNPFAYCDNDPVNFKDPTGHMKWWKIVLLGLAAAAALGAAVATVGCVGLVGLGIAGVGAISATGIIAAGFGAVASASVAVWEVTEAIDLVARPSAASYNTPDSGSATNSAGATYKKSHAVHKWAGWVAIFTGSIALGLGIRAVVVAGAVAATETGVSIGTMTDAVTTGTDAMPAAPDASAATSQAGPAVAEGGSDLAGQVLNDASQRQSLPTNQALLGSQHGAPAQGPSLNPADLVPAGHPHAVAFTGDIFPSGAPARQRQWGAPTPHTAPGLHPGRPESTGP